MDFQWKLAALSLFILHARFTQSILESLIYKHGEWVGNAVALKIQYVAIAQ